MKNGDPTIILKLFDSPKIIGVAGDSNQGKSNLLYWLITELRKKKQFNLYSYGLRIENLDEQKIYTVRELEVIQNSVIILDEFATLFDLENRKYHRAIEQTLRLIFHNNNIVLVCGLPDNFRKFISSKLGPILFKRCTLGDFVNGSSIKEVVVSCHRPELGSTMLNLTHEQCMVYDGSHYTMVAVPYIEQFDTKKGNAPILSDI